MAVTQQLARLSPGQLAKCRSSVEELDKLCSFDLLPFTEYLNLDWAPAPLIRVFELAQVSTPIAAALRRGLDGDVEINPAYRDHQDTVWEHPVVTLEPDIVADVAALLGQVEPGAVLGALPEDATAALLSIGMPQFDGHPRPYLQRHLAALRDFYAHAAHRRLAVALWWD
ncbi:hypothetical protein GA0074695_3923 [Micromonospora viridifaciens]|uniref:DUF1877 domain-containing protein n=1 Tax=Micromonospora viridifaciens TaxID=1881 RepID=A0A1C4Y756_MICVI|nr:DUF1877 domain-containing protein [Micromonospora viridifaciens]SCF16555.1 hypothetical protein GA0074695_3923 [Micromonospora viridifaciens]